MRDDSQKLGNLPSSQAFRVCLQQGERGTFKFGQCVLGFHSNRFLHCYLSVQTAIAFSPLYGERIRSFHLPLKLPVFAAI